MKNLHRQFGWRWAEELKCEEGVYVRRWVLETPIGSIRLHHWLRSDDARSHHDHSWSFVSFIFRGGYSDITPESETRHRAPSVVYRSAEHKHWVRVEPGGCWSFLITGPKTRRWGFWLKDKFIVSYRYFYAFGKHICE